MTSAPAVSSASVAVRRAARETTTVSGTSGAACTSWESSGRRPSESNTMRRGWRCTPSTRAVSCGSSASAVPIPTATASHSARQRWARVAARLARDPLRVAGLASRPCRRGVIADLNSTHGRPVRACLRKGWLSRRARAASSPSATIDLDALVAQDPQAAAGGLLGRVVGGDDDPADARLGDRVRARRRPALVAARLERDVHASRRAGPRRAAAASASRSACGPPTPRASPRPRPRRP